MTTGEFWTMVAAIVACVAVLVNAAVGVVIVRYTRETGRMRVASEATLAEMREQTKLAKEQTERAYETYVRVTGHTSGRTLELTNLGPAPAIDIEIRAIYIQPSREGRYFRNSVAGLPAQRSVPLILQPTVDTFGDWPHEVRVGHFTIEISAKEVTGKPMRVCVQLLLVGGISVD